MSETKKVQRLSPDWGVVLSERGLIVNLNISWYKGQQGLSPEDLDLEKQAEDPKFRELFQLGKKSLIPKEVFLRFQAVENRARKLLRRFSCDTPFGKFISYTAYPVFEKKITEIEKEFSKEVETFEKKWSAHRRTVIDDYRKIADRLFTNGNKEIYTRRLIKHIEQAMPSRDELASFFNFEWTPFHIVTPSELAKEKREASIIEERRGIKYQVNQKLAKKYEKESERALRRFVGDYIGKLRSTVTEVCEAGLKSIKKNDGIMIGRLSTSLSGMVENFKLMDCFKDGDIAEKLETLRKELGHTNGIDPKERGEKFKGLLDDLKKACKEKIAVDSLSIRETRGSGL